MAAYKISSDTLTAIADAVRAKTGKSETISGAELAAAIESIDVGEVVLESAGVAFSSEKVDPDVNYKVGRNWLADLVEITQKMAGKSSDMTLDDVIYWLNRVQFIPQGNAESVQSIVSQISIAVGIVQTVYRGTAISTQSITNISNAVGSLAESA